MLHRLVGWAYPERFAQEALGQNSKAVHRVYAKNAQIVLPSRESFKKKARGAKALPFPASGTHTEPPATAAKF
jgi:hypothetical protein